MSDKVKRYMRVVAKSHCEDLDQDQYESLVEERDELWERMSQEDRDTANQLVLDIFEEFL